MPQPRIKIFTRSFDLRLYRLSRALYEDIRERYDTPVIVMSADKSSETVNRIQELNIDDYLTKPLYPAVVREAIRGILQRFDAQI